MKILIFVNLILLNFCFSASAEVMYRLGEKPSSNDIAILADLDSEIRAFLAEQEAIQSYVQSYPEHCFFSYNPEYNSIVDGRLADRDGNLFTGGLLIASSDPLDARRAPKWYNHFSKPGELFQISDDTCANARQSFADSFSFSSDLLNQIGATEENINPGQMRFLRRVKLYETVSGEAYIFEAYSAE